MSPAQIRFFTLLRREVNRFLKIKRQTLGAPLLETFLYVSVFGAALGSRIDELHGIDYVVFIIPGLIMMAWAINAFANNSSSILQQKFQRAIDDQLSSPASPLQLLLAFHVRRLPARDDRGDGDLLPPRHWSTSRSSTFSCCCRRSFSSASSSLSSACSWACAPSSSTMSLSRRRSCSR